MSDSPSRWRVVAAFAAIYVIWGSTYLAIRFAIETLPPFLMAGARFGTAGVLLYGWMRLKGEPRPTRSQWLGGLVVGGLLLLGGNGGLVWAEQFIPSGLAALLVATVSLWMVLFAWWMGHAERPGPLLVLGLVGGLSGVALLVGAPGLDPSDPAQILGGAAVLFASAVWALGSVLSRDVDQPARPAMGTAVQMLCGGGLLLVAGLVLGEGGRVDSAAMSLRSVLALGYLIVFGSLIAFSAYIWLLRVTTAARVSTYAYVNPLVALILGWALASEPLSGRTGVAAAVILASVALINVRSRGRPSATSTGPPREGSVETVGEPAS